MVEALLSQTADLQQPTHRVLVRPGRILHANPITGHLHLFLDGDIVWQERIDVGPIVTIAALGADVFLIITEHEVIVGRVSNYSAEIVQTIRHSGEAIHEAWLSDDQLMLRIDGGVAAFSCKK